MDTARKLLRLFETAREYATLLRILKQENMWPVEKALAVGGQCVMMLYWIAENLYVLAKLKILPLGQGGLFKATVWLGLAIYICTLATQHLALQDVGEQVEVSQKESDETKKKSGLQALMERRRRILMIIGKESADNICLLPLLGIVRPSKMMSFVGSLGSLYQAVVSLYMRYK